MAKDPKAASKTVCYIPRFPSSILLSDFFFGLLLALLDFLSFFLLSLANQTFRPLYTGRSSSEPMDA